MADETRESGSEPEGEPRKASSPTPPPIPERQTPERQNAAWKVLGALYHGRRESDWKTRALVRYGALTVVTLTVLAILRTAVHEAMTGIPRDVHNALELQGKTQKDQSDAVVRALEKAAEAQLRQADAISQHMAVEDRYFAVLLDRANVIVKHTAKPSSTTIVLPSPPYQQAPREPAERRQQTRDRAQPRNKDQPPPDEPRRRREW